jgi:Ca-activated chloride channel family protein
MQSAPTLDHNSVREQIDELELHQQTAIGDAIRTGLAAIDLVPTDSEGTQPPGAIVLLSDGDTTVGTPNDIAAAEAAEAEVPVSTIAFGTDDGFVEIDGQKIPVPVNAEALEEIATTTGGNFFTAASEEELTAVYENIGSSVGYEEQEKEITAWFVGLGIVLLAATAAGSLAWFSRLP